jgi:hypothetical protein
LFYTVYRITNTINGKHYIGKHQTKDLDDGYFGSGKLLRYAIKKYGKDAFVKQILRVCSTEKEMDLIEKILVVPDPEISYNLCNGGQGGWSYLNRDFWSEEKRHKHNKKVSPFGKDFAKKLAKRGHYINTGNKSREWFNTLTAEDKKRLFANSSFCGKTHSEETKKRIGLKNKKLTGKRNGSFGTCWITNGQVNKKIKKDELDIWLEKGYYKGRI